MSDNHNQSTNVSKQTKPSDPNGPISHFMDWDVEKIARHAEKFRARVTKMLPPDRIYGPEDVVQDVILKSLEKGFGKKYNPNSGAYDAWLYGTFRNTARAGRRKFLDKPGEEILKQFATPGPNLLERMEAENERLFLQNAVNDALNQLPHEWQVAIRRRYGFAVEGCQTRSEERRGLSTPSVYRNRARKLLRVLLQRYWDEFGR